VSRHAHGATAITKFESDILGELRRHNGEATTRQLAVGLAPTSLYAVVVACQRLEVAGRVKGQLSDDGLERTWRVTP
jgi:hypothetical protein